MAGFAKFFVEGLCCASSLLVWTELSVGMQPSSVKVL